jgi:hypothetical protein
VIFDGGDTMTDCLKVAVTARVHFCNSTYVSGWFVLCEMRNRGSTKGSTSDKFALVKVGKRFVYLSAIEGRIFMPTTPDYFEIHNHAIRRSIQEIIKMHTWFYVNG